MLAVLVIIFRQVHNIYFSWGFNDFSLVFYKVVHKLHVKSQIKGNSPVVGHKISYTLQFGFCVDWRPVWKFSLKSIEINRFKLSGFTVLKITSLSLFCLF
jgi:hypothetical protein